MQLDFSMTNTGPATIFYRGGEPIGVTVVPPPGTTIVGSSANCSPQTVDDPQTTAHGPYACSESRHELVDRTLIWNQRHRRR